MTSLQRSAAKTHSTSPTSIESSAKNMPYNSFLIQPHQPEVAVVSRDDAHPSQLLAHTTDVNHTGNPAANHANSGPPPAHITGLPPPVIMGLMEQGNQSHDVGHLTSEIPQFVPFVPGQFEPRLEYYPPPGPPQESRNFGPPSGAPYPYHASNVAGPLHGNPGSAGMPPTADDLKHLANHYLYSPRSHVEKLRVRRRRTGGSKVLIVLDIDDTM